MSVNDIILLNVGGKRFETSRQTLLSDPQSMLAKMFDPESRMEPGVEREGAYFLDRDPHTFGLVLTYLRSGLLLADKPIDLQAMLCEARYFSLLGLEELVLQKLEPERSEQSESSKASSEFRLNVGGKIFVTTKETLCKYSNSKLANLVEGKIQQTFDSEGNLFLDEDPKDFAYILRALRNSNCVPTSVPKEYIDNVLNLRDNLEIREIKFGYREQTNSFVSEYFLSVCR